MSKRLKKATSYRVRILDLKYQRRFELLRFQLYFLRSGSVHRKRSD